jgi:hypothetical protein
MEKYCGVLVALTHDSRVVFSVTNFVSKKIGKRSNLYGRERISNVSKSK